MIEAIDDLLNHHTEKQIATRLNEQGLRSGTGNPFNRRIIAKLRDAYGLKPRYDRLRDKGMLTKHEVAKQLDVSVDTVKIWRRAQRLKAHAFNDKGEYLYEPLDDGQPTKYAGSGLKNRLEPSHLQPIEPMKCSMKHEHSARASVAR